MNARILIADDDPLNQITLEAILQRDGYELHFAHNGLEACEQARRLRPDLMLLDVMMPEVNGFEVCRRVRRDAEIGRMPIILITALLDEKSRLEGLRAGADDFLSKPCPSEELRARVRTVASLNRFRTIAEQSARFERLFELAPAAIVVVDEQGRVCAANPGARGLLGMEAGAQNDGCPICGRFDPASAEAVRSAIRAVLHGETPPPAEVRRSGPEGGYVMSLRVAVVPEDGARRVMLVLDDVTNEVNARESLRQMNAELDTMVRERTRQLEEANELLMSYASFVSHDLRSPLTVVKGYLSMLVEGVVPLPPEAAQLVTPAYNATLVMQDLVQNILQLAKDAHEGQGAEPDRPVDPQPVIVRLTGHLRGLHPQPEPEFVIGPLPPVGVSAVLIERVFYNLLTNAMKYSASVAQPKIEIGGRITPEGPVLFVRDNGVGFDSREADKLFQEFSRLPGAEQSDGLGLGLALVARMLRAHRGRIWAEGEKGAGATFYVQLPPPPVPRA
ncbi:sensor histidine kinase [Opitutus terrae]|uniref:histidine kinase n=1 Tax=Opitutus terrae (strain DSM 11246 / JCM 15787 / PB90-1) TaxID=452637 RepID=B1ZQZ0_OPITP|nr:response regulator [Opitutus terrae]ACB73657.1 multi-sensor signal transduction histidine kinase [Opitutus terrae PB90-1]